MAWIKRQYNYTEALKSKPLPIKRLALYIVEDIEGFYYPYEAAIVHVHLTAYSTRGLCRS